MSETTESIVNLALAELGSNTQIASMHGESKAARIARAVYEPTVKELLREHPWHFARRTAVLAPDAAYTLPLLGWAFACKLPNDFVKVVQIDNPTTKYSRHGQHLLIDNAAPELVYVARVSEAEFDPLFVSALSLKLAARMCKPVTDSDSQKEGLEQQFRTKIADAKLADAVDGAPDDPPMGLLETVRL